MQSQEETEAEEGKRNENKFMGNRNNNVQQSKSNKKDYLETRGNKELELWRVRESRNNLALRDNWFYGFVSYKAALGFVKSSNLFSRWLRFWDAFERNDFYSFFATVFCKQMVFGAGR